MHEHDATGQSGGPVRSTGDLQFDRAEPVAGEAREQAQRCVSCQQPIGATYYHAQGQVVPRHGAVRVGPHWTVSAGSRTSD